MLLLTLLFLLLLLLLLLISLCIKSFLLFIIIVVVIIIIIIIIIIITPRILYFHIKLSSFVCLGSKAERKILPLLSSSIILLLILSLIIKFLLLMEQDYGRVWRSGKAPATLRTKEMVAVMMTMRMMIIQLYIYVHLLFIYLFIYVFIYLFVCLFNYLFIYYFPLNYWNLDGSIRSKGSHLDRYTVSLPQDVASWQICKHSFIFVTPQFNPVMSVVIIWW